MCCIGHLGILGTLKSPLVYSPMLVLHTTLLSEKCIFGWDWYLAFFKWQILECYWLYGLGVQMWLDHWSPVSLVCHPIMKMKAKWVHLDICQFYWFFANQYISLSNNLSSGIISSFVSDFNATAGSLFAYEGVLPRYIPRCTSACVCFANAMIKVMWLWKVCRGILHWQNSEVL